MSDSIRRVTADSGCVSTIVQDAVLPLISSVISLVTMFILMWALDPVLTLTVTVANNAPASAVIAELITKSLEPLVPGKP